MHPGTLHHVELWVEDLERARRSWGWLLSRLGYERSETWPDGESWSLGGTYLVLESGPDRLPGAHERRRAGLNHLAFWGGPRERVDALCRDAHVHGWRLLFTDRYPFAGGPGHYAAYLEDAAGFEVEIVADPGPERDPASEGTDLDLGHA